MKSHLAKIHIARQQLGMDDDTYRAMLQSVAGVRSSKDLDKAGYDRVMKHLIKCGFQPKPSPKHGKRPDPKKGSRPLIDKIEAQLADAGRPWAYAHAMAKRMYKVEKLEWCTEEQLRGIVTALAKDARRHGRDE